MIAPPYDVLSPQQADRFRAAHPHNITRVDVPTGDDRYQRAGELFRRWVADGVLIADPEPSLSIYRMQFTDAAGRDRSIAGVLGGLEVVDPATGSAHHSGGVLPHERTTPKASTDRLDLTRATGANLSPVWGLSLAAGLTDLLAAPGEVLADVVDDDPQAGTVRHVIERVRDPERIAAITALIGTDDVLIADGHHRYGVARIHRDEIRAATGRDDTPAEDTLAFISELVADQLSVAAIHRLYSGRSFDELSRALERFFDPAPIEPPDASTLARMEAEEFLVLVGPQQTWSLKPKAGAFDGIRALDGLWLETALAELDVAVDYQHGVDEVRAAVAAGDAAAGVLIRPVSVSEIERTAREGVLMPPKSTFFTPKLKTGFVIRPLT
ncbi:hypothetical protein GCM10011575_11690 [Microlunatus endophyticus]|uniref:DUF1015 domain-containing protein n=1 Tax=Microlunatus endophyticus TaxID=1716077 RepID=A0A917S311_9ACTN|nr:hypothetical protein GCM10011575_11690 [Microlunatus endophyticus]